MRVTRLRKMNLAGDETVVLWGDEVVTLKLKIKDYIMEIMNKSWSRN